MPKTKLDLFLEFAVRTLTVVFVIIVTLTIIAHVTDNPKEETQCPK